MPARGSGINPRILQQMLDSATNAAEKGQSQFFTPLALARRLALALPKVRPCIVDLNCGGTALLQACANGSTETLLGSDIDPVRPHVDGLEKLLPVNRLTHDLTRLYPLLKEVGFSANLFALNPPWRLWWHRDRLAALGQSKITAVRDAFAQMEEAAHRKGTVDGTVDSTMATLMIALDLLGYEGEGFLVANNATLERLLFAPGAPHAALAQHVWAHVIIPGNPMTGIADCLWEKEKAGEPGTSFNTGVIYFAVSHTAGPTRYPWASATEGPLPDRLRRMGSEVRFDYHTHQGMSVDPWDSVKEHVRQLGGGAVSQPWNLWLSVSGRIRTHLSRFEERSVKVNKKEAERLHQLEGCLPMELVLQRSQRDELLHVIERGGWKVEPALIAAVQAAVNDYHGARAPLYPLPAIQRLGYLDELDVITCTRDLTGLAAAPAEAQAAAASLIFKAGEKYSLRTQTVQVTRRSQKFNPFLCQMDDIEFNGQELAIYISNGILDPGAPKQELDEYCFMDQKIKNDEHTKVTANAKRQRHNSNTDIPIDFTLQQLAEHFAIPEVPDVATTNPEGYKSNLAVLTELETLTGSLTAG